MMRNDHIIYLYNKFASLLRRSAKVTVHVKPEDSMRKVRVTLPLHAYICARADSVRSMLYVVVAG